MVTHRIREGTVITKTLENGWAECVVRTGWVKTHEVRSNHNGVIAIQLPILDDHLDVRVGNRVIGTTWDVAIFNGEGQQSESFAIEVIPQ